jgi:formylglycine-generating enzyme required for sulfatase activity
MILRVLFLAFLFVAALQPSLVANNIQVTNPTLTGNTGTEAFVQFTVSWENSWRGGGVVNWDAAWVFVKFRTAGGVWHPAYLAASGHVAPAGSQVDIGRVDEDAPHHPVTNPVVGVFVRRRVDGSGTFTAGNVQLRFPYAQLGFGFNDLQEVRVFAIEMVHVNEGPFRIGDGTQFGFFQGGSLSFNPSPASSIPFLITSEAQIPTGETPGQLAAFYGTIMPEVVGASYPKGYRAFYCMKYEIAQQQYVDMLNTLGRDQQNARTGTNLAAGTTSVSNRFVMSASTAPSARNGIACSSTIPATGPITFFCDLNNNGIGGEATDGQWTACGLLNVMDLMVFMDWSGLRHMTELEYEKACRGPIQPVSEEYAWGSAVLAAAAYTFSNAGSANESIASNYAPMGNAILFETAGSGPRRVGICAAQVGNTGRVSAGASYYGIMDMTGNVDERVVPIAVAQDNRYALHGDADGMIPGNAASAWVWRGGPSSPAFVSHRGDEFQPNTTMRSGSGGGRGVRTAP